MNQNIVIAIVVAVSVVIIALLIFKNKKDRKVINPDAENATEEERGDEEQRRDTI
jgi:mannose/fructose/N-acetylgalactosamine-specific phosphotransferase system component IIC